MRAKLNTRLKANNSAEQEFYLIGVRLKPSVNLLDIETPQKGTESNINFIEIHLGRN